jgi:hypothetical protein
MVDADTIANRRIEVLLAVVRQRASRRSYPATPTERW